MILAALVLAAAAPAGCALPPGFEAWPQTAPLVSGAELPIGGARDVALVTLADAHLDVPASRKPAPDSFAGQVTITIQKTGRYRVALDAQAWIDIVSAGKPLDSTAHAHGPACSTIRKIVDFQLGPGRYTIQLSGAAKQQVRVQLAGPA